jgi:hypothetical protein
MHQILAILGSTGIAYNKTKLNALVSCNPHPQPRGKVGICGAFPTFDS